jgi:hypothetical protein
MKKSILLLCAAAALVLAMPAPGRSQVLVPGNPPLTEEMIGRFAEYFEWAFSMRLTNDQSSVLRKYAVDIWKKQSKDDMELISNTVLIQIELSKADPKQVAVIQASYEPQALEALRKQPNDPIAAWLLTVYDSSHKVLAQGNPPLTRQVSDAFLEALFFMLGEVQGKRDEVPSAQLKNDMAASLTSAYPRMSDDMKKQMAGMPLFVAQLRLQWPALAASEKAKYRATWAEAINTLLPAATPSASNGTATGKKSIGEMMAEQNRRHESAMNTNSFMRNMATLSYNTSANFSGNPWRYW